MTSYEILKPIASRLLGTHDSGIINVNEFATGNEVSDNFMNEAVATEVGVLIADESIKAL